MRTPLHLVIGMGLALVGCGPEPTPASTPPSVPRVFSIISTPQTLARQPVAAGAPLKSLQLTRPVRTPTQLVNRVQSLLSIFLGRPSNIPTNALLTWAQQMSADPLRYTPGAFPNEPGIVISYQRHGDFLTVSRSPTNPPYPFDEPATHLTRAQAITVGDGKITALRNAGLLQSLEYGLVHSMQKTYSEASASSSTVRQHLQERLLFYQAFYDGFPLRNSIVELQVANDGTLDRLSIADVSVIVGSTTNATRSREAAVALLKAHVRTKTDAVNPTLDLAFGDPVVGYMLDPTLKTQSVFPRVFSQWTTLSEAAVSKKHTAAGTLVGAAATTMFPGDLGEVRYDCPAFRAGLPQNIATNAAGTVLVHEGFVDGLMSVAGPLYYCQKARVERSAAFGVSLNSVDSLDALYRIGLRTGDRAPQIRARVGPDTGWYPLASLADAAFMIANFSALTQFAIRVQRGTNAITINIDLRDCAHPQTGVVDCRVLQ